MEEMKNLVSIVEIPVNNLLHAAPFYQSILDIKIEMQGTQMGIFSGDEKTVNVVPVKGDGYKPSSDGTPAYLNAGDDLKSY